MKTLEKALKVGRNIAGSALIAATALLPVSNAKADLITIANTPTQMPNNSIVYPVTIESNNPLSSIGYDTNDHELTTSTNTVFNFTAYEKLNTHKVDYNFTPEPQIGDTYTLNFGIENRFTEDNMGNNLILSSYILDNTNGVNDYQYILKVDTNADGDYLDVADITRTGLLSEVWTSTPKTFGNSWEQRLPEGTKEYGQLTLTAIPEPATSTLLVGAGLALGAGYAASQFGKKK